MPIDKKAALEQIEAALNRHRSYEDFFEHEGYSSPEEHYRYADIDQSALHMCLKATIERLAPPGSSYTKSANDISTLAGVLRALQNDYEAGYLQTYQEMIHGQTFSDFLEMADHLLKTTSHVAAATISGGVLEQHLRALCAKHSVAPIPENLSNLNAALYKNPPGAYGTAYLKQVTAWADIRNDADHGHFDKVDRKQVELMIAGIRHFMLVYPA